MTPLQWNRVAFGVLGTTLAAALFATLNGCPAGDPAPAATGGDSSNLAPAAQKVAQDCA